MKFVIIALLVGLTLNAQSIISRASVHDPSIFKDNGNYYVFGSHLGVAKSPDLINWQSMAGGYDNPNIKPLFGNILDTFKESFKWAGYNDGDNVGGKFGIWVPDMVNNS